MDVMLSTIDNPYSPFTQWNEWYAYDAYKGYHTGEYLARIVRSSDELSEADQNAAIDDAIQEIIKENPLGIYRPVTVDDYPKVEVRK
jgi:hypothetical protein